MRIGSLFAGIGGFDLAARWMGWDTAWFSEIDPYASAVLTKHWPDAPNHGDIRAIDFTTVEPVDILAGGFPCQDTSNSGTRTGLDGPRSGLWREFARAIRVLRPRYVVVENVAALAIRGLDGVLGDLAVCGYDAAWRVCQASEVGSPQERSRLFLAAWREWEPLYELDDFVRCDACDDWFCPRCAVHAADCPCLTPGTMAEWPGLEPAEEPWGYVAYPNSERGFRWHTPWEYAVHAESCGEAVLASGGGTGWAAGPPVCGVAHGIPRRVDRLRGLGNAIVPHHAVTIYRWIAARERYLRSL